MFIGPRIFLLFLFLGWQANPVYPIKGNPTKAFQDYFSGVNHFKEGNIPLANQYFKSAYDHCMNAQAEIKLMSGAVRTWIPVEEE